MATIPDTQAKDLLTQTQQTCSPDVVATPPEPPTRWLPGVEGNFPIHREILKVLPAGTTVLAANSHGTSSWAKTARIDTLLADSTPKPFFLKVCTTAHPRAFTEGEFVSALLFNETLPGLCPKPTGWGHYDDGVHFFVGDFVDMDIGILPDAKVLASKLATLHTKSAPPATGKFGFPVPTAWGSLLRPVAWCDTWVESFTLLMRKTIRDLNSTNPAWPACDHVSSHLIEHVVPRLLGTLDIKPALVHNDLWEINMGHEKGTGNLVFFDAGSSYSHNEIEFGSWRAAWSPNLSRREYLEEYWKLVPPTEPADEWDDRNRLYCLQASLWESAGTPGSLNRQRAFNDMLYLVEKYAPIDMEEKYDPAQDVSVTGDRALKVMGL